MFAHVRLHSAGLRGRDTDSWSHLCSAALLKERLLATGAGRYPKPLDSEYLRAMVTSASNVAWMQA